MCLVKLIWKRSDVKFNFSLRLIKTMQAASGGTELLNLSSICFYIEYWRFMLTFLKVFPVAYHYLYIKNGLEHSIKYD
jgi:hypothetical protein